MNSSLSSAQPTLAVSLRSLPPLLLLVWEMEKTRPGAADRPVNDRKPDSQCGVFLRRTFRDEVRKQTTSEKSFVSARLIADSAIQFLRTYLGLTPESVFFFRHFTAKSPIQTEIKMLTFHSLLTTGIAILMLPDQMGLKKDSNQNQSFKLKT